MKVNIYEAVLVGMDLSEYRNFAFEGDECHLSRDDIPHDSIVTEEQLSFIRQTGIFLRCLVIAHPHTPLPYRCVTVGERVIYDGNATDGELTSAGLDSIVLDSGQDPTLLSPSYFLEDDSFYPSAIFPIGSPPDLTGWVENDEGRWAKDTNPGGGNA